MNIPGLVVTEGPASPYIDHIVDGQTGKSYNFPDYFREELMAAYDPASVKAKNPRWLRFNFEDSTHKSLRISGGTYIRYPGGVFMATTDYTKDMGTLEAGKDYFVFVVPSDNGQGGDIVASLQYDAPSDVDESYTKNNTLRIGMFSTLCSNVGNISGDASASTTLKNALMATAKGSLAVGNDCIRKNYNQERDPDFYEFYKKNVLKVVSTTQYDVVYTAHPLSRFQAGDILPESVWCLTWHIKGDNHRRGLVYEQDCGIAAGIYLQSGTGRNTASKFNVLTTRSRAQLNHSQDMAAVGMRLLGDQEFSRVAQGSNEKTSVQGSNEANSTKTGGSVDTQGRRMISDIGCEDCCGKINQWLEDVAGIGGSGWSTPDGNGALGSQYGSVQGLYAGGDWGDGSYCGSRERSGYYGVGNVNATIGGREAKEISTEMWQVFLCDN